MSFKIVQTTKINKGNFTFENPENVSYPIAPAVSVKTITSKDGVSTLITRTTLYINAKDSDEPFLKSHKVKNGILTLVYKSNFTKKTPETCDVWYVEGNYTINSSSPITKVVSFLCSKKSNNTNSVDSVDPDDDDTSRGTKTQPDDD